MDAGKVRHRAVDQVCKTVAVVMVATLTVACAPEKRAIGPAPLSTPPTGPDDPRAARIEANVFEVSEGGRQFRWAGCGQCHGSSASGFARLDDRAWRCGGDVARIYASIAAGCGAAMPAFAQRLTSEQTWRLAAYVKSLSKIDPHNRQRSGNALAAEPDGRQWKGPLT